MPSTYTPIATQTLGSSAASVTFSSISGSYTDLILIGTGTAVALDNLTLRFNSDTGNNYSYTNLNGNGSSAGSTRQSNQSAVVLGDIDTTNISTHIVNIQNYSNTTTFKTVLSRWSNNAGTYASLGAAVNLWRNTSAISTILIYNGSGNLKSGSTFTLYGVKSA